MPPVSPNDDAACDQEYHTGSCEPPGHFLRYNPGLWPNHFSRREALVFRQDISSESPIFIFRELSRALRWVGGAQVFEEIFRRLEGRYSAGRINDRWNCGWERVTLVISSSAMTASFPAILVIVDPQAAKFVGQALTSVTVAGHTV